MSICQGIKCTDRDDRCPEWASRGRCKTDQWVYRNCLLSCLRTDLCDIKQPIPSGMVPVGLYFLFQTPCHVGYSEGCFTLSLLSLFLLLFVFRFVFRTVWFGLGQNTSRQFFPSFIDVPARYEICSTIESLITINYTNIQAT